MIPDGPAPDRSAADSTAQEIALRDPATLLRALRAWAAELGFGALGVARTELPEDEAWLKRWLALGRHGDMAWMARHGTRRSRPAELVPGTLTVIAVRMDYFPPDTAPAEAVLAEPTLGYLSRYALGRDYHKVLRARLQALAERIGRTVGPFGYRVFTDSAPVLEKALAREAGLGWIGKHTNLLAREAGSWFFLGEIYTDLPLPVDAPPGAHCGSCEACIVACPTDAIVAPHELDARRCISYLTIEHKGPVPREFRIPMGNRIYGCDDCLAVCPWNKFASRTAETAFHARAELQAPVLAELAGLDDAAFRSVFTASPVKRIGRERFVRNVLIALGNSASDAALEPVLARLDDDSALVRGAAIWALSRLDAERFASERATREPLESDPDVRAEWAQN